MKMRILLPVFLILLLAVPFSSALNFDWLFEKFYLITGKVTDSTEPVPIFNEQVKCTFLESNSVQTCYTGDGSFKCSGTTACTSDVYGGGGKALTWKSSCGGEVSTTIDGNSEEIVFKCVPIQSTTTQTPVQTITPTPVLNTEPVPVQSTESIREQVKCTFLNSNAYQKCYAYDGKFACSGIGNCLVDVFGIKGTKLAWKSSCGGYFETVIDGQNNEINFECPQLAQPISSQVQPSPIQASTCTDSDGPDYYTQGKTCAGATCEIDVCDGNTLLEYICDGNLARVSFTYGCTFGCQNGACIRGKEISEQVTCIFTDSGNEQECYPSGSLSGKEPETKFCRGKGSCIINHNGYEGEQVTWKSTCGGYQYTIQDGSNKEIKFECNAGEINFAEVKNKGFRVAYWQCYDGTESKSGDGLSCKSSEAWQQSAAEFCKDKCYKDNSKCGVNSFSISNDCYTEGRIATPTAPSEVQASIPTQGTLYYFRDDNCEYCQEMDVEIGFLKQNGFFNNYGIVVYNVKEEGISQKFDVKMVPSFIFYKGGCDFRKEGFMKSDEIKSWADSLVCGGEPTETIPIIEPVLVCKDSCPLDDKCYPFGYRKSQKFCSDQGTFIEQLKEEACENNFECSSNVCVDGKCISSSLIQKFLGWLRNLF